jgi:competence ComEA-like helix-hairpin-helix protein
MKNMPASERALPLALVLLVTVQASAALIGSCPQTRSAVGTKPVGAGRDSPAGRIFWGLPLDMDLAGAGDLERISGIGRKRARRIVRWRREHGPVEDPGRLEAVPGIGPGTVELLKNAVQGRQAEPGQAGMQDAMKY